VRTDLELYLEVESILIGFFLASCTLEAVARFDWPLSVCLLGANLLSFGKNTTNSKGNYTAGSSSRISTMSGVSFKGVAAIGGRSGYVEIAPL
jgi:hypothetical protein